MMFLSVVIVLHGTFMPYISLMSNILEIFLSASLLSLLLIRNADNSAFNVIEKSEALSTNKLCYDGGIKKSYLSYLLIIPYYIPLLFVTLGILYWLISSVRLVKL